MKKIIALLIAMMLVLSMTTALAAGTPGITIKPNTEDYDTTNVEIDYTYYKILSASIETDPEVGDDGSTTTEGKVAYYVEVEAQANALTDTGLFTVTKVDGQDKWYVELTDKTTTAAQIVEKFKDPTFLANFTKLVYTKPEGTANAVLPGIEAGYYYIESSIGTNAAVQTLSPVEIIEKNVYPSLVKEYDGTAIDFDKTAIGTEIPYKVTVEIPAAVAEKDLTIVDTITKGLTLDTAVTVTGGTEDYTSATFVLDSTDATTGTKVYKIVIPATTVIANAGKTLVFSYKATVNEQAIVLEPENNTGHLEYDNGVTPPSTVTTKTLAFDIQKVDSDGTTVLAGAEFKLYDAEEDGNEIAVVALDPATSTLTDGTVVNMYRVAVEGETGVVIAAGTARIEGLNDQDYWLEEVTAPTGYNLLDAREKITPSEDTSTTDIDLKIKNNKGATLPSTGGVGTTIFYIAGSILVLAAAVLLITKRRMGHND